MSPPVPFGRYLLLEPLSSGPLTEVFAARDSGLDGFQRIVALKRLQIAAAEDEETRAAFLDEARIAISLTHANIVHVLEVSSHEDSYFLAMEYVSGQSVASLIARTEGRPLPLGQALFIASRMCEGLDYAHRRKDPRGKPLEVVHRGVSPKNVLLSYDGEIKLIDFGMAKAANRLQRTQVGATRGQVGYMSPEAVRGEAVDRRADIFGVGVVLYEMLTGNRAFTAESDYGLMQRIASAEVLPPSLLNPLMPEALEAVVMKALSADPAARYAWAADLQADLLKQLAQEEEPYSATVLSGSLRSEFAAEMAEEESRLQKWAELKSEPAKARGSGPRPAPARTPTNTRPAAPSLASSAATTSPGVARPRSPAPGPGPSLGSGRPAPSRASVPAQRAPAVEVDSEDDTSPGRESPLFPPAPAGRAEAAGPSPVPMPWDTDEPDDDVSTMLEVSSPIAPPAKTNLRTSAASPRVARAATPPPFELPPEPSTQVAGERERPAAASPAAPPAQSRRTLAVVGAAVAALLIAVVGWQLVSAPKTTPILVQVSPAKQAEVTVGGRRIAEGTVTALPAGEYDLVVAAPGFKRHTQKISVFEGEAQALITVTLEPVAAAPAPTPAAPATFRVNFDAPAGTEIKVDGRRVGVAPEARLDELTLGRVYRYEASKEGFVPASGEFSATEAGEVVVLVTLVPQPPVATSSRRKTAADRKASRSDRLALKGQGLLLATSNPPGAEAWVDSKPTGRSTPISADKPLSLPVGTRRIVFELAGMRSKVQVVEIRDNAITQLKAVELTETDDL